MQPTPVECFVLLLSVVTRLSSSPIDGSEDTNLDETIVPKDISDSDFTFITSELPRFKNGSINFRLMPEVGNGHLAHVPFSDTVYLSGLYNGARSNSHRARIPSYMAVDIDWARSRIKKEDVVSNYTLHLKKGYFEKASQIKRKHLEISQRVYAYGHPELPQLIVYEVRVLRMEGAPEGVDGHIYLKQLSGQESEDISFEIDAAYPSTQGVHVHGRTKIPESNGGASEEVHVFHSLFDDYLHISSSDPHPAPVLFLMSVDRVEEKARTHYENILSQLGDTHIFEEHCISWQNIWKKGRVDIEGNLELAKMVHASLYYLISSLPTTTNQVGGLSAGGLAHGEMGKDFQGHVTWEHDAWMFSVALMLQSDRAKHFMRYRVDMLHGATSIKRTGFPWESANGGSDVTPANCSLCTDTNSRPSQTCEVCSMMNKYAEHVNADIAVAARQYVLATRDINWLSSQGGFDFFKAIASYIIGTSEFDRSSNTYNINGVIGPDVLENNNEPLIVDNSLYTNLASRIALSTASYIYCLTGKSTVEMVPEEWEKFVSQVMLPKEGAIHLPFAGYSPENFTQKFRFPSPIAVGFPLDIKTGSHTRRSNLEHYAPLIAEDAPPYAWSTLAAGWAEVGEMDKAKEAFTKTFTGLTREPFLIWTDTSDKKRIGRINYITAMASFLQSILFGFGGIRLYSDRLYFNPKCPVPEARRISMYGIDYMGCSFDMSFDETKVILRLTKKERRRKHPQVRIGDDTRGRMMTEGQNMTFSLQPFSIHVPVTDICGLPKLSSSDASIEPTLKDTSLKPPALEAVRGSRSSGALHLPMMAAIILLPCLIRCVFHN